MNSVMGEFYTVLSKVLKTLDTVEITGMGFPTDVKDRLTSLIDLEEQTFLRNRGLFTCNDSTENLVLDMFRTDTICDTNFDIPPLKKFNVYCDDFNTPDFNIKRKKSNDFDKASEAGAVGPVVRPKNLTHPVPESRVEPLESPSVDKAVDVRVGAKVQFDMSVDAN